MRSLKFSALTILVLGTLTGYAQDSVTDLPEVVQNFLDAFNAHDPAAMSALVADDVKWLSVNDGSVSIELEGKEALSASMIEYFASCPTCRSEMYGLTSSGERVCVVEVASWVSGDGPKSQQSLAVYEFSGSLIQNVYYFPAEPVSNR